MLTCVLPGIGERLSLRSWSLTSDTTGDYVAQLELARPIPNPFGQLVVVSAPPGPPIWVGYVTTAETRGAAMTLTAVGLARRLEDVRYTAFWSDTRFSQWAVTPPTAWPPWRAEAWQYDTNNRLYVTTRPGETYGGATGDDRAMGLAYRVPARSLTALRWIQLTVDVLGGMWGFAGHFVSADPDISAWTLGPGLYMSMSGTYTWTDAGVPVAFVARPIAPVPAVVETNPAGTRAVRATAVRVAAHAPPITPTEIAAHALSHAQAQLGAGVVRGWQIDSSTADVEIAVWEDATVRDVVTWAAQQLGVAWWVERSSQSILISATRPRRQWTVRGNAITVTTGNDQIVTRVYARYKNPAGTRTLRTTTAINTDAEQHYRISRTAVIDVETTSAATAEAVRDAYLAQMSQQPPSAVIVARQRGDLVGLGGPAQPWEAEPGDQVLIAGAPPLTIARRTITPDQTTYELTAPAGTLFSALAR